jgi:hypothetical protein
MPPAPTPPPSPPPLPPLPPLSLPPPPPPPLLLLMLLLLLLLPPQPLMLMLLVLLILPRDGGSPLVQMALPVARRADELASQGVFLCVRVCVYTNNIFAHVYLHGIIVIGRVPW